MGKTAAAGSAQPRFEIMKATLIIGSALLLLTLSGSGVEPLKLSWTNNLLTVASPALPGGKLEIWYLEAFCRKGSAHRDWSKTIWPHRTTLLSSTPRKLSLRTDVGDDVEVNHEASAVEDGLDLGFVLHNRGT